MRTVTRHPARLVQLLTACIGAILATGTAWAATSWIVGLGSGSSAASQGSGIQLLTMSKPATVASSTNQLYPGGTGDVQLTLTNPNKFPVTVTGLTLPQSTSSNYAAGYSDAATSSAITGCGSSASLVTWTGESSSATMPENLSTGSGAFTIAGSATITVTLTNDATMGSGSPLVCAGTSSGTSPNLTYAGAYFVLPSLVTVAATGGIYSGQPTTVANGGSVTTGW